MNKKELSAIKKDLKVENSGRLRITEIFNAYCKADCKKIMFSEKMYFDNYDEEIQEMFYANFKKILTGSMGAKIFELDFEDNAEGKVSQNNLYALVESSNDFKDKAIELVEKMIEEYSSEMDFLASVAKMEFFMPTSKKTENTGDGRDDNGISYQFIICTVSAIEPVKKSLKFDYEEKELTTQSSLDLVINLNKPMDGFVFPTITEGFSDVNKVLYCSSKANQISQKFANGVLNCTVTLTSKQEKDIFGEVLTSVLGDKVKPQVIHNIYENIAKYKVDSETPVINTNEVKKIFEKEGLDSSSVDRIIADELGLENFNFKVDSIIPSSGKSIKVCNSDINVAITPSGLKKVKQTVKGGKKCLIIELDESVNLERFELEIE